MCSIVDVKFLEINHILQPQSSSNRIDVVVITESVTLEDAAIGIIDIVLQNVGIAGEAGHTKRHYRAVNPIASF